MNEQFIGPYEIDQKISTSGLSVVYAATDTRDGRRVAIKLAESPASSTDHASVVGRFRQESLILRTVKHRSVASFSEEGTRPDGSPYFVMEWIEGRTLAALLDAQGRLSLNIALTIAAQVAGALGAAHACGFVHRDLKSNNIMVLDAGSPDLWTIKLLDFGVGGILLEESQVTVAGGLFGTVFYMSPEQIRGEGVSPRSDIWQLGVLLFEMLTGSLPWESGDTLTVMTAILNAEVTLPADVSLPSAVAAFLKRCLAKDPVLRPANGREAEMEIERLRDGLQRARHPLNHAAPALGGFAPAPVAAAPSAPMTAPRAERAVSRTWSLVGVAVMGCAGVLVVGFLLLRYGRSVAGPWWGVLLGISIALLGMLLGRAILRLLAARLKVISHEAQEMLTGARSREQLTQTLAIQVDDIVARCRLVDERFLAMTLAVMVDEYGTSTTFDDRQKALMNAVTLLEKLTSKLSPWYLRHDKVIALIVTLVGILSGLATVAQNVVKLVKGS